MLKRYQDHLGASIDKVFSSDWEHFQQMTFLKSTPETDLSISSPLDQGNTKPSAPKKSKASQESNVKAALYPSPAKSFETAATPQPSTSEPRKT